MTYVEARHVKPIALSDTDELENLCRSVLIVIRNWVTDEFNGKWIVQSQFKYTLLQVVQIEKNYTPKIYGIENKESPD